MSDHCQLYIRFLLETIRQRDQKIQILETKCNFLVSKYNHVHYSSYK